MSTVSNQRWRSLAHNRDFTVLWVGQTISELGTRVSTFVFPLLTYALTGSAPWAAAAEAAYLLGLVGMLLPAGVLADRCDRRRLMRFSAGSGAVLYGSLVAAALAGHLTLPHVVACALGSGITSGLFSPAETSALRTVVPDEDMATALSQQQGRQHVANLLGAPLGGALYGLTRWAPFLFDAVSYAAAWLLIGRIRTDLSAPAGNASEAAPHPLRDLRAGLRFAWSKPFFRVIMVWAPSLNLVSNAMFFVALLRLIQGGYSPGAIAAVEVAAGLSGILGAIVAPWIIERLPTGMLAIVAAWTQVPLIIPMAVWNHPVTVGAGLSLILLMNPAGNAGFGAYRMAITPPALIGRVQSAMQFVSMIAMPLAPVLAGGLLGWFGGPSAVLALGALCALVALIPTLSRSVRSIPRPAQWRDEVPLEAGTPALG